MVLTRLMRVVSDTNLGARLSATAFGFLAVAGMAEGSPSRLELPDVMARALAAAPEITALEAGVREQEATAAQAGRWSNPVLTLEKENFAGSRAYRGSALAEYTATLDQTVELGGKRGLRRDLARADQRLVEAELAVRRSGLMAEVRRRYLEVQLAQAQQRNAQERLESARSAAAAVQSKRGAGVTGGLEAARTEVAVSLAEVELANAISQLEQARERLARLWGGRAADATGEVTELVTVTARVDAADAWIRLEEGGRWRLAEMRRARQEGVARLARARPWPDVTVSVGRRWFEEGDDHAWVAAVSVPLPVLDRNRDGVRAARAGLDRATAEMAAEQRALREMLALALSRVKAARASTERLETETLPLARRSYTLVEEGFKLGRYDLLYLLEAQQTLFATEAEVLKAQGVLHLAHIDLEELLDSSAVTTP